MKRYLIILFVSIPFLLFNVACSSDDENTTNPETILEAEVRMNVSYGEHPSQVYDLYLPEGRTQESTKVIILVHGGGWTSGDKNDMIEIVNFLQANHPDYAVANINYVLAEIGVPAFPNQFLDLGSVLSQLTEQQNELHIQPQFGLIGTSAGAHISLMYDSVYDLSDQVKFVADIVGPSDFTDPFYANNPNFELALQLLTDTNAYPPGSNLPEVLSPVFQVSENTSPTILFYGSLDPIVPISNGFALENALNTTGINYSFTVYEGGHGDDWSTADVQDLQTKLEQFMLTHLPID
ncbi:alpha/beta hydrolase [uncultured Planktosalinus sp.]|uniref:alpha/beta hydrolase n=1 Tax=uncultured Planktosalinus sp. TaxID=1810935 RepID=UPI0030D797A8